MNEKELREFRARFNIPISDEEIADMPFYRPADDSTEIKYLLDRRRKLGGFLPKREVRAPKLELPSFEAFGGSVLKGSGTLAASTTMAFVTLLRGLLRYEKIGRQVVAIIPGEDSTCGVESLF